MSQSSTEPLREPFEMRQRVNLLLIHHRENARASRQLAQQFEKVNGFLEIANPVTEALKILGDELFEQLLRIVEDKLTVALQEILDQPIRLKADAESHRGGIVVKFSIERQGEREDVLKGTGGSVANILSVGLRMFALATLDNSKHRRFLVLDEQDCWLQPEVVPRLVKIIHEAGAALGFQVLLISHHDVAMFEKYAQKIYRFSLDKDAAVVVREVCLDPSVRDSDEFSTNSNDSL